MLSLYIFIPAKAGMKEKIGLRRSLNQIIVQKLIQAGFVQKLQFMKMRAVNVCAKAGIESKVRHKKPCFRANFQQSCLEEENS
jgi:hypothetical protein